MAELIKFISNSSSLLFTNDIHDSGLRWNFVALYVNQLLVGMCQREVTGFYLSLLESKYDFKMMILQFYVDNVRDRFDSKSYTFDVYDTKDGPVKHLDFNPWGASTLPLLFTWEELEEKLKEEGQDLEIRIIENQRGGHPGMKIAVPYDHLDTSPSSG